MTGRKWLGVAGVTSLTGIVAAFVACVGSDPTSSTTTPNGSDGGGAVDGGVPPGVSPDAAPSIGCPVNCLPPAPANDGWTGPSAVYDGDYATKPAGCPNGYTQLEIEARGGAVTVDPSVCDCGTATTTAKCTASVTPNADTAKCASPQPVLKVDDTQGCITTGQPAISSLNNEITGSCSFPAAKVTGPDPKFERASLACGLPLNATCTDRPDCVATPLPDAPFNRLCIHKSGEVDCPSLDYAKRFVQYRKVTDDRSCNCTGTFTGSCGAITIYSTANCAAGSEVAGGGGCRLAIAAKGDTMLKTGLGCTAVAPSGTDGGVSLVEPETFCCNK